VPDVTSNICRTALTLDVAIFPLTDDKVQSVLKLCVGGVYIYLTCDNANSISTICINTFFILRTNDISTFAHRFLQLKMHLIMTQHLQFTNIKYTTHILYNTNSCTILYNTLSEQETVG
jgi:hypothetical protein